MDVLVFFFADLTAPAAICLAVCGWASCAAVLYLTHDASPADFDPRPAVQRALTAAAYRVRLVVWDVTRSEALYPLLRDWDNAPHDARELAAAVVLDARLTLRHAAVTGAALAALLLPATEGATR